jgi:cytidylate kinase
MVNEKIIIAIDGHSSCGKSTLAKELAKELNYIFIDSGAMYRAVSYYAIKNKIISEGEINITKLINSLPKIELEFKLNRITKSPEIFLNGSNIEDEIRKPNVAEIVSNIAAIKEVREKLVAEQRKMGRNGGIIMDGRDIGSVVFPNAELKFFITADIETRTNRRFEELKQKGIEMSKSEVEKNLKMRDEIDSTRIESPLIQTKDAIVINNTNLSKEEQLDIALNHVKLIVEKTY